MKSEELKIKNYGFTLVEIILVLAITFIVATIIVVSFSRFSRGIAIGNDVQNVVSFLEKARSIQSLRGMDCGTVFILKAGRPSYFLEILTYQTLR